MIQRRILYFTVLTGSLVFFWAYRQWLSGLLLTLVVLLPLFSLLLSLPAILSCKIQVVCPTAVTRGSASTVSCEAKAWLPLAQVGVRFTAIGSFDGRKKRLQLGRPLPTAHCGAIRLKKCRAWVCDYLGLFCVPVGKKQDRLVLVRPTALKPQTVPDLSRFISSVTRPKAGGGYSENHELRLYRSGDSLKQVHWKLSAKTGKLITRESMEPIRSRMLLTMELRGNPTQLDVKLGRLLWMSRYLLECQLPHSIQCLTGKGVTDFSITCPEDIDRAIDTLLQSSPAQEIAPVYSAASWRYHIGGDAHE